MRMTGVTLPEVLNARQADGSAVWRFLMMSEQIQKTATPTAQCSYRCGTRRPGERLTLALAGRTGRPALLWPRSGEGGARCAERLPLALLAEGSRFTAIHRGVRWDRFSGEATGDEVGQVYE